MAEVILSFSMSLDGFVSGPDVSVAQPMGRGGEQLHSWMFDDVTPEDATILGEMSARVGAVVLGRRTFDVGLSHWGDTPFPAPSFVVTHRPRAPLAMTSAGFTFVDDGPASAVAQARAAAGDRDVVVMGAETARQCLALGLVDQLDIQLIPVMLGDGLRLFPGSPGASPIQAPQVRASPAATHLRYRLTTG